MSNYMNNNCDCNNSSNCTTFNGNSVSINVDSSDCEIRTDVVLTEYKSVRLWGRILNCDNEAVENALIKLVKVEYDCKHEYYVGIAHSVSDCNGFYQFELCNYEKKSKYKLLVSKSTYESNTVKPVKLNEHEPCEDRNICSTDSCKPQIPNPKYCEECNKKYNENKCYDYENKFSKNEVSYSYQKPKYYYSDKY